MNDGIEIQPIMAMINRDDLIEAVRANFTPEEVFDDNDLGQWAEDNGFIKND